LTGFIGIPSIPYLSALRLEKDHFVTAVCLLLLSGGITLSILLNRMGFLTLDELVLSALGLVPLFIGLSLGQRLRRRISQELISRAILVLLGFVGVSMIARAF